MPVSPALTAKTLCWGSHSSTSRCSARHSSVSGQNRQVVSILKRNRPVALIVVRFWNSKWLNLELKHWFGRLCMVKKTCLPAGFTPFAIHFAWQLVCVGSPATRHTSRHSGFSQEQHVWNCFGCWNFPFELPAKNNLKHLDTWNQCPMVPPRAEKPSCHLMSEKGFLRRWHCHKWQPWNGNQKWLKQLTTYRII